MKTLILYASTHGCTETCAVKIKDKIQGEANIVPIKSAKSINPIDYDTIIIGGSIHAGRIQGRVRKFCQKNEALLLAKRLGLFLCCMEEGEKAEEQFNNAYPQSLRKHAAAKGLFGGEFNLDRMNFVEKAIVKKVAGVTESVSKISGEKIERFLTQLN